MPTSNISSLPPSAREERELRIAVERMAEVAKPHQVQTLRMDLRMFQLCHARNGQPFYTVRLTRRISRKAGKSKLYYDIGGMVILSPRIAFARILERIYIK